MLFWRRATLDLRSCQRAQNQIGDIADNRFKRKSGIGRKLLPRWIVAEDIPLRIQFRGVGKAEHVGQAGHALTDKRVSEEDHLKSGVFEDFELAGVEHLHLQDVIPIAGALVGAELKDALALREVA